MLHRERLNPNRLLVEGDEDKRVIPQLIEAHGIAWGERRSEWIVEIEALGGIEEIVKPDRIITELGRSNLARLGILVDADQDPDRRWQQVCNACIQYFPALPEAPLAEGTIVQNDDGQWLGVWIMPDNGARGMLETFLAQLVRAEHLPLWEHADKATSEAAKIGAPYNGLHRDKARIHAWLAWQDPPGRQLHDALIQHILDPRSPYAAPFVAWFRELYAL